MKIEGVAVLVFALLVVVPAVMASPGHRYDYTTKSCRNFSDGKAEWDSRPWGEGGKVFRQVCKKCHFRGNKEGTNFLHVESKTSKAWNRVFAQHKVACAKNGAWKGISQDQELKLNDYLYRFAAFSQDASDEV